MTPQTQEAEPLVKEDGYGAVVNETSAAPGNSLRSLKVLGIIGLSLAAALLGAASYLGRSTTTEFHAWNGCDELTRPSYWGKPSSPFESFTPAGVIRLNASPDFVIAFTKGADMGPKLWNIYSEENLLNMGDSWSVPHWKYTNGELRHPSKIPGFGGRCFRTMDVQSWRGGCGGHCLGHDTVCSDGQTQPSGSDEAKQFIFEDGPIGKIRWKKHPHLVVTLENNDVRCGAKLRLQEEGSITSEAQLWDYSEVLDFDQYTEVSVGSCPDVWDCPFNENCKQVRGCPYHACDGQVMSEERSPWCHVEDSKGNLGPWCWCDTGTGYCVPEDRRKWKPERYEFGDGEVLDWRRKRKA